MSVTNETLRLTAGLRNQLAAITDQQVRDLTKAWVIAFDEVAPDLNAAMLDLVAGAADGTVTRAMALRSVRLQKSLAVIADNLDTLATQAGIRIVGDLPQVVRQAGVAQQAIIASQLPSNDRVIVTAWSRVDPGSIEAIVKRSTEQITALSFPISADAYQVVRRELIRGVAAGSNPRETASRMVARAEGGFNGGLSRALTIARTETLDAHRAASALSMNANSDTLTGWMWQSALTERTCEACWSMDGTEHDLSEDGPDGHQCCACDRVPIVKSWRDLGIDMEEPASIFPDAQAVFNDLPDASQLAIMGPQRLSMLQSGDISWSDLATKTSTAGWRDSYQATSIKDLAAKAAV